jgi:hypothetical protein
MEPSFVLAKPSRALAQTFLKTAFSKNKQAGNAPRALAHINIQHTHQKSDRIFFTFCACHHRISTSDIQQPRTSTHQHVAQTIVIFSTSTTNG